MLIKLLSMLIMTKWKKFLAEDHLRNSLAFLSLLCVELTHHRHLLLTVVYLFLLIIIILVVIGGLLLKARR